MELQIDTWSLPPQSQGTSGDRLHRPISKTRSIEPPHHYFVAGLVGVGVETWACDAELGWLTLGA